VKGYTKTIQEKENTKNRICKQNQLRKTQNSIPSREAIQICVNNLFYFSVTQSSPIISHRLANKASSVSERNGGK